MVALTWCLSVTVLLSNNSICLKYTNYMTLSYCLGIGHLQGSQGSITLVRTGKREFVIPTEVLKKSCPKLKAKLPTDEGSVTHVDLTGVDEIAFEAVTRYFRTGLQVNLDTFINFSKEVHFT